MSNDSNIPQLITQAASLPFLIRRSRVIRIITLASSLLGPTLHSAAEIPPALQAKLDKNDFVVTTETFRQGFSAYLDGKYPAFITSDSILMAYTTLLEKMVGQQHLALFGAHVDLVAAMAKNLPEPADEKAEIRTSRLFIGCAYRILIGALPGGMTEAEGKLVEREAQRVEKAEGNRPPDWWGAKSYVPYSRFLPTSTWDKSAPLRRYFRYSQWMQSLPVDGTIELHVKICEELYQVFDEIDYEVLKHALDPYYSGVENKGVLHALDEIGYINVETEYDELTEKIQAILQDQGQLMSFTPTPDKALIDDQLEKFHDLSRLTGSVGKALGNALVWPDQEPTEQSKALSNRLHESNWIPDELYLSSLMKLNTPVDERAPKLFHTEAWQRKQLNCTMGAWAEYRHAVAITQTTSASWMSMFRQDPGYVEPVPEFFQTLGTAAERLAGNSVEHQRQKARYRIHLFALQLEEFANTLRETKTENEATLLSFSSPTTRQLKDILNKVFKKVVTEEMFDDFEWDISSIKDRETLIQKLEDSCQKFWRQDTEVAQLFTQHAPTIIDDVTPRCYQLALLCLRLESLSHKQLAGLERSDVEIKLIKDYGKTLGYLMFYEGNSYLGPRDDAPKIVQVAHLGQPGGGQVLQCGTARPRQLLIRYPNRNGEPVLCQGSVYAYRERIAEKPVSNVEWLKLSKKSKAPQWLTPEPDAVPGE